MELKSVLKKGLQSMKAEKTESNPYPKASNSEPDYPYGLRIDLNKESLSALGLSVGQFKIGETVCLKCKADVISVRAVKSRDDESENVELQITDLGFEKTGDKK